eukprot:15364414-Ditylum_brightwellii.AAC.1
MRFDLITIAALTPFLMIGTSGAECTTSCATVFIECVENDDCDNCLELLKQGHLSCCKMGCELTDSMEEICPPSDSSATDDASLSRYPKMSSPGGILRGLDYLGTVTFALTGSVTAAQSGLDVFGCCMVGM